MPGTATRCRRPTTRMLPDADTGRPDPRRNVEVDDLLVGEFDAAVVGHDELDIDALATQFGPEPGRCRCESADRRHRCEFGGGEDDPHVLQSARCS